MHVFTVRRIEKYCNSRILKLNKMYKSSRHGQHYVLYFDNLQRVKIENVKINKLKKIP